MSTAREKDFAIAVELLSDAAAPLAWSNLGDWSAAREGDGNAAPDDSRYPAGNDGRIAAREGVRNAATDYDAACRALARRVGTAAALTPEDRVLDLACGHGASLALWPEAFGVRRIAGLEYQSRNVDKIRAHAPAGLEALVHGRFDVLPAPAELPPHAFDAVVCVDAAYHAASLTAFVEFAAAMLQPRGRLAFTTLIASRPLVPGAGATLTALRLGAARAGIPAASLPPEGTLYSVLSEQGFGDITLQTLDTEVLQGFSQFVPRRRRELSWRQKASAGWLKIEATGWLCRQLIGSGALHYVLVSARRA
ncbi:MAG: hypothetical protein K0S46_1724 [Moraxellaceae bacterium]|jgi:2-polyprenyl-3-methyl-5-hydroxy-6-metoxy-1,4-benzoquinol methylase|nr:hypothetical protein [Moraxellaceae bacterium]